MANFILIFICFALGMLFRKYKIFPANAHHALNRFVIYVSLPALTLAQIHRLNLEGSVFVPVSMAWFLYIFGVLFFFGLSRVTPIEKKSLGTLMLTGGLGNTSFVGFPLLEAFYGVSALSVGILCDQPGSFLVLGTLGVITAVTFAGRKASALELIKKVFIFPPFLSLIIALALRPFTYSEEIYQILDRLGGTLAPLTLVAVGLQLHFPLESLKKNFKNLCIGLSYKLALGPLLCFLIYVVLLKQTGEVVKITLVESAMAPMITAGILATEYDLDSELATLMIGIGIPLSLITVPAWVWFLGKTLL